jgi:hypothetical protein
MPQEFRDRLDGGSYFFDDRPSKEIIEHGVNPEATKAEQNGEPTRSSYSDEPERAVP